YHNRSIREKWFFSSKAEILPRQSIGSMTNSVAALPRERGAASVTGSDKPFPKHDRIYAGNVKVIRSGRRNQIQESIQNLSVQNRSDTFLYKPFLSAYNRVISIDANTYTDEASASDLIAEPTGTYFNPFVT